MNKLDIFQKFPNEIKTFLTCYFEKNNFEKLEEIRIRTNKPIILKFNMNKLDILYNLKPSIEDILYIIQKICNNSIYAYQNEICEGFITINGGHRIGITGRVVFNDNKIQNITNISSINFRIAREIIGCSKNFMPEIIDKKTNSVNNTLIISPPRKRKNHLTSRYCTKFE
jgi:stage III sporulation protein AA